MNREAILMRFDRQIGMIDDYAPATSRRPRDQRVDFGTFVSRKMGS
ncbi:hypothetical protein [Novosphingobium sp. NBM11]|nr:hypothetical protein [Novosphingobium sp. NBM11]